MATSPWLVDMVFGGVPVSTARIMLGIANSDSTRQSFTAGIILKLLAFPFAWSKIDFQLIQFGMPYHIILK